MVGEVVEEPERMPVGTPYFPILDASSVSGDDEESSFDFRIPDLSACLPQPFFFSRPIVVERLFSCLDLDDQFFNTDVAISEANKHIAMVCVAMQSLPLCIESSFDQVIN